MGKCKTAFLKAKIYIDTVILQKRLVFPRTDFSGMTLRKFNFQEADLRGADVYKADLKDTNLTGAKVTKKQTDFLEAQGLSGFVVVE